MYGLVSDILTSIVGAAVGGWIAARIALHQIRSTQAVEDLNDRRRVALELIEASDSYVHIAYRSQQEPERSERQRLRRRIESLGAASLSSPSCSSTFSVLNDGACTKKAKRRSRAEPVYRAQTSFSTMRRIAS